MYRFSRALFLEIKDLVDPHPDTISVADGVIPTKPARTTAPTS